MGGMLRALLKQLIHQEDSAVDYMRERWSSASESDLKSLPVLQELVQDCLATQQGGTIVLDGLDECQDERGTCQEPRMIIDWIQNNLISEARLQGYPIRVLVSSQHVDFLEKELTENPSIRLDQDARHLHNIEAYAKSKASKIQERFFLTDCKRDSIVEKVSASSNGQFKACVETRTQWLTFHQVFSYMQELCWIISWNKVLRVNSTKNLTHKISQRILKLRKPLHYP